jgi:hypothetical protein
LPTVQSWIMGGSKRRLVPEAESLDLSSPWFLFNDFVVKNISEQEALSFQDKWKVRSPWSLSSGWRLIACLQVPAIIYLERTDLQDSFDFSNLPSESDSTILIRDTSISMYVVLLLPLYPWTFSALTETVILLWSNMTFCTLMSCRYRERERWSPSTQSLF